MKYLGTPMWGIYVLRLKAKTPLPLSHPRWPCIAGHREESNAIAKILQRVLSDAGLRLKITCCCMRHGRGCTARNLHYQQAIHTPSHSVSVLEWSIVDVSKQGCACIVSSARRRPAPQLIFESWWGLIEGCLTCGRVRETTCAFNRGSCV